MNLTPPTILPQDLKFYLLVIIVKYRIGFATSLMAGTKGAVSLSQLTISLMQISFSSRVERVKTYESILTAGRP